MTLLRSTQVRFAVATLLLAALVVAVGAWASLSSLPYFALVGLGVVATLGAIAVADVGWSVVLVAWTPWFLVVLLPRSVDLAAGLLLGGVIGILALPVVLCFGELVGRVAG